MNQQFLGGLQLAHNIQIHAYKNDEQHWLSLVKDDKFIDFVTSGPEIGCLTASDDGKWFAYFQKDPLGGVLQFCVWKCDQFDATPFTEFHTPLDTSLELEMTSICFNSESTHIVGLCEWNHVAVIGLDRLDAPTEFYILNGRDAETGCVRKLCKNFIWVGHDGYARTIVLNTKYPTMRW
jgi:hypothetical protein